MNKKIKKCRVCGSKKLKKVINLGYQYLQSYFAKQGNDTKKNFYNKKYLTELVRCNTKLNKNGCGLVQLSITLPPKKLYSKYFYESGVNHTMRSHLHKISIEMDQLYKKKKKVYVLDIGCNDGTLLNFFSKKFVKFGIDPSDILPASKKFNINYTKDLFPSIKLTRSLNGRKFDIITTIAMFYDLENPNFFVKNVYNLLNEDGIWIFEVSYLLDMLKLNSFDTICHEHIEYYSLNVIEKILSLNKMKLGKVELNKSNGGSIRCYVVKKNYDFGSVKDKKFIEKLRKIELNFGLNTDRPYIQFNKKILQIKKKLHSVIVNLKNKKKKIHIYGASTKGNTILQWCKLNNRLIDYAAERNPKKYGLKTLGTNIPIISEKESRKMKPDYYLILPWHFKKEFLNREKLFLKKGGGFIFPLPQVEIYKQ